MRSEKTGSQILNLSLDDTVAALLLQPGQHCVAAASVQAGEGHDGDLRISENVRNAVDEVDKNVWNKEIQVSRALEEVDNLMKQVYTMALQHDLRNASGKLVSIHIDTFKVGTELEADVN